MTHPTKAIMGTLLKDFVKVNRGMGTEEGLYATMARTELLDFHQTIDVDGIKVPNPSIRDALWCWDNGFFLRMCVILIATVADGACRYTAGKEGCRGSMKYNPCR